MSVSSTTRKQQFVLDGIEDGYTFTFRALTSAPEDIKCSVTTGGTTTALTYTTNYSVSVNSDGIGGTVTLVSASTIGLGTLTVYRETTNLQSSDYDDYNQFPANTLEEDLDIRTMVDQEQDESFSRALKFSIVSTTKDIDFPEPSAGKSVKWNDAGTGLVNSTYPADGYAQAAATSATIALGAQVAAELAETNAETAETNAETAQAAAEAAATSISSSGTLSISRVTTSTISITNPVTLPNNSVATTQSQADASTKLATTAYVDTGLGTKVKNDGTVNPTNLLTGGDFENWSAGTSSTPDGWTKDDSSTIAREGTTIKIGTYSAKLTTAGGGGSTAYIYQVIHTEKGIAYWKNRTISFSVWVNASDANLVRLQVSDGVSNTFSTYHTGGGTWERLTVTKTVGATATSVEFYVISGSAVSKSFYVDGAMCVEGESAFAFADKPLPRGGTIAAEVDETKFSHKIPVYIDGTLYYIMLTQS